MKALITIGCKTDHGGIVVEADSSFLVEGKAVHLEGMKHVCPKCKKTVSAISLGKGFLTVGSKTIIMAGDKATCGATFLPKQSLVVRTNGGGSGSSSSVSSLVGSVVDATFSDKFLLVDRYTDEVLANVPYKIYREDGSIEEGKTDSSGRTKTISNSSNAEQIKIEIKNNDFDLDEFFSCHF